MSFSRCYEHQKQDSIHILCTRLVVKNSNKQNKPKIFAQPNTLGAALLSAGRDTGSTVQARGHERRSSCPGHEQVFLLSMLFRTGMNRPLESNPDGWVWGSSQRPERLEIINAGTFWPFYLVRNPLACKTETVVKTKNMMLSVPLSTPRASNIQFPCRRTRHLDVIDGATKSVFSLWSEELVSNNGLRFCERTDRDQRVYVRHHQREAERMTDEWRKI